MSFLDKVKTCNEYTEENKIPFIIDGLRVGKVLKKYERYCLESGVFIRKGESITLKEDFVPHCTDGEVEEFYLMPIEEVAKIVRETNEFKLNCNLVVIDFLVRHGYIGVEDNDYIEIVKGLRQ